MDIIKGFMRWAYFKESKRWSEVNNEERIIVRRQFHYINLLAGFGIFANVAIYNTFFVGLYNFRTYELLNMRQVPFPLKIGISTVVAGAMTRKLYLNGIYEPALYRVALNYRPE